MDVQQGRDECEGGVSTRVTDTHTRGGLNLKAESAPETVTEEKAETGIKTERETNKRRDRDRGNDSQRQELRQRETNKGRDRDKDRETES